MIYHITAFVLGFVLDCFLGDPYWLFHPVRLIGKLISFCEKWFLRQNDNPQKKQWKGRLTVLVVCLSSVCVSGGILGAGYGINPVLGCLLEAIMTYQLLAAKCLKVESMKVYYALENDTIEKARKVVSMIVGRDTQNLTDEEVTKAAVETVAENTSDGVIAPMLFTALGGPVLGFLYKAVNTMDSMIAYKNEKYLDFGRCAAKTDDVMNFLPARLSAVFMILSCFFLGKDYSARNAWIVFKRDRFKHQSPNSAQTESVCAGALGVRLAGPAYYEGVVEDKPFLGDARRVVEHRDIKRANALMYGTTFLCAALCVIIMAGCCYAWR